MKDQPISVTIDESPEPRGRPAVAVLATFYGDELPGRRTLMIDLQMVQQCNAVINCHVDAKPPNRRLERP
ncbi:hypothetical protein HPB48_019275 [Haemaphysalis longicornis]|uniref:Uncharacterized protein n=1 Tax=Haemaphysalis longicornis TaxID=44386 RepID=A0A9J6FSG5_HAELO|nr:hypothetical protein HPB48_019275 [Haemaphysalis longicornis]